MRAKIFYFRQFKNSKILVFDLAYGLLYSALLLTGIEVIRSYPTRIGNPSVVMNVREREFILLLA